MSQIFDPRVDYYAILGVTSQATADEIKSGYRKRSLSAHPDAGGSHAAFLLVNQAYQFLRDKNVRAAYDAARQPAATPTVIHHWQQAAQPAATSAATVTDHFEHDLKGFDAWVNSVMKDFASASYGTQQEGRYNFPTVTGSKSGAAFIWLGRAVGAAVGIAVAVSTVDEIRQGNWQDIRKVGYLPLYVGLFQWIGAGVGKFLHAWIREVVVAEPEKKIVYACTCGQKLRVPHIVATMAVTCTRCNRTFGLDISATGVKEVCPCCKSVATWDRVRCSRCGVSPKASRSPLSVVAIVLGVLFGGVAVVGVATCLAMAASLTPWWYGYWGWGTGLWFILTIMILGIIFIRMWMRRSRWTPEGRIMGAVCLPLAIVVVATLGAIPATGSQLESVARKYAARGNHDQAIACWERLRRSSDRGTPLYHHAQRALAKYYGLGFGGKFHELFALWAANDSGYSSEAAALDALGIACCSADVDPCGAIDYVAGAKYFEKAAILGDGHAMFAMALCYIDGKGVKRDVDVGRGWLVQAVHAESPEAMEYLGNALVHENDPDDQADGVSWLTKAATRGNIAAMRDLAACYRSGKGVAASHIEAERWEHEAELRTSR